MPRYNYTVELMVIKNNRAKYTATCRRGGQGMTPEEACLAAVAHAKWDWPNVAHAKALRVYIKGEGWVNAEA